MSSTAFPQSRVPGVGAAISVRRFANDEIARVGSSLDDLDEGHRFEFLCECGDLSCAQFVRMTVAEYHGSTPGSVVGHPVSGGTRVHLVSQGPKPDDGEQTPRHRPDSPRVHLRAAPTQDQGAALHEDPANVQEQHAAEMRANGDRPKADRAEQLAGRERQPAHDQRIGAEQERQRAAVARPGESSGRRGF